MILKILKYCQLYIVSLLSIASAFGQEDREYGRIYVSHDMGTNWERSDAGFPVDDVVNAWVAAGESIIAGTDTHGILISKDHGKHWYLAGDGLAKGARIVSLLSTRNKVFAGTYRHGLFVSTDQGESWTHIATPFNNISIRALTAFGNNICAGTDRGLYRSFDGETWALQAGGIQINDMAFYKDQLFAASSTGLIRSKDSGISWQTLFKDDAIYTLAVDRNGITLLDYTGNIYRSPLDSIIFLRADLYLPTSFDQKLTPGSVKMLSSAHSGLTLVSHWSSGLPQEVAFSKPLNTPYGTFTAVVKKKC